MLSEKYYTAKELAKSLSVTPMTIYRLVKRGELKAIRVGESYRFAESDIEEYLKQISVTKTGSEIALAKNEIEKKSTARSLLKFAGTWAGNDAQKIKKLIIDNRLDAEF